MMACVRCGCEVEAHYDHVGDCPDGCEGTYYHPRVKVIEVMLGRVRNRPCALSGQVVNHSQVRER